MNFIKAAQEAEKELAFALSKVAKKSAKVGEKASELARQEATLLEESKEIVAKKKELQAREEEIVRKASIIKKGFDAKSAMDTASADLKAIKVSEKKAEELKDESKRMLEDLTKRELALSKREKEYRNEIKQQIASKMLGI